MPSQDRQPTNDYAGRRELALLFACSVLMLLVLGLGVLAWNNGWVPGAPPTSNERAEKTVERVERQVGRYGLWNCTSNGSEGDRRFFACDSKRSPDDEDFVSCTVVLHPDGRVEEGMCNYSGGG